MSPKLTNHRHCNPKENMLNIQIVVIQHDDDKENNGVKSCTLEYDDGDVVISQFCIFIVDTQRLRVFMLNDELIDDETRRPYTLAEFDRNFCR